MMAYLVSRRSMDVVCFNFDCGLGFVNNNFDVFEFVKGKKKRSSPNEIRRLMARQQILIPKEIQVPQVSFLLITL